MRACLPPIALLALAACSPASDEAPVPKASATTAAAPASAAPPSVPPAQARSVEDKTPLYDFDYAYPAQAAAIPALKAWLDGDIAKQKADIMSSAKDGRDGAKESGFPFNPYGHSTSWDVVTDLPGWLSLSAQRWEFTGGAHGNPWSEGLLWDKAAGKRRDALSLFTSKAALSAAIRAPFCDALDKQRAERREAPVDRAGGDMFDECIDPVNSAVILGSADKQHFTRIGVLVDPYEAGPYAEGNYEVTVPVTAVVLQAVKPEYRAAFALGR
ncbi:MAG: DUF3298 and DUF4163 domain-containing protein [Novosphingobium sp.]|nr:DUF3298 and DUF4163 domain-containing protein [Novosphingobium sp.]